MVYHIQLVTYTRQFFYNKQSVKISLPKGRYLCDKSVITESSLDCFELLFDP